ncbi:hypothetical protein [Paracoccus mutanolyticus]|uniref:hypothetical protein n=1 Tax=Paracoccus mutanolyticus TaxID=1499308 RepID=UPI0011AE5163|nr:hypothetical protein [Paracoccus mutanolyticus]
MKRLLAGCRCIGWLVTDRAVLPSTPCPVADRGAGSRIGFGNSTLIIPQAGKRRRSGNPVAAF